MEKLIVSLDLTEKKKVYELVEKLGGLVNFYKVGIIPYLLFGNEILRYLKKQNKRIFLDLKFFDIPNTVEKAVKIIFDNEIDMFTVHLMAGEKVIKNITEIKDNVKKDTKIIGVTVLTSFGEEELKFLGIKMKILDLTEKLVEYGYKWGIDGVVCSGEELKTLRPKFKPPFLFVVPGIRVEKSKDDQKRITTPNEAIKNGADFIVVGRPIYESENPVKIVKKILRLIKNEGKNMD
ncbi:MAG: orotidine-5'-phosphate decarboxylase [Candidatus Omnitrophica bacterium]|nr:orotidine-5'-phosphate decarboxylase [Candidatus Omnitrophota bacterium]MCM8806440.1 orotidine-5'-phosphate decarboxylase [Candidatus Omnitrophota bacterium]